MNSLNHSQEKQSAVEPRSVLFSLLFGCLKPRTIKGPEHDAYNDTLVVPSSWEQKCERNYKN